MTPDRWRRIEELYHAALELHEGQRAAYVKEACAEDSDLRREVESLLAQGKSIDQFLERPALEAVANMYSPSPGSSFIGRRMGSYQVISLVGAGGMGEVYQAHDTKLGRDVAIKVLPEALAQAPERLARFQREAKLLASLNHPNIATIHGLEQSGDTHYLVMELVPGETLRERVAGGPVPVEEALTIAKQIAEALEAAHNSEKVIIHRDLKPENVKVTPEGRVKVLDFGLAKAVWGADEPTELDMNNSPTLSMAATRQGVILGTAAYMSPEQARGQTVDRRTDVWGFGCVFYELLTGKRPFQGETSPETIAAVLEREPDWQALPAKTPTKIRELLWHCLQKDANLRLGNIADARRIIEEAQRGSKRRHVVAAAAAVAILVTGGIALGMRGPARLADRSQWVQLTQMPDSVSQPALSPDGRMLAFIRGPFTFFGTGQIYVKILPDGAPVQLTHDNLDKMSPVFSPDGARIAYTTVDSEFRWDTWLVPALGGEPQRWLRNASGLAWTGPRQVLFSEMKKGVHMGIVAAEESGIGGRDVYLPASELGMAHRSYLSPDGKSVLLVEMDHDHLWVPCRLVPMDGSSQGRSVGPPRATCTFAAWSPDGKWMYFSSLAGGSSHIWRQRFPDGQPQQMTSGPTVEEGIAMAPDGRSFVTAVALETSSLLVHDASGERQISLEGNAANPKFTPDGKKLCYQIQKEAPDERQFMSRVPGEIWVSDLQSGHSEPLVPGLQALDYDISTDGQQIVMEVEDGQGKPQLWLASFERQSPPRQVPNAEGRQPRFGPDGEIFFRSSDSAYRVRSDGTGLRKAIEQPIAILRTLSPDGRWLVAWAPTPGDGPAADQVFPLGGGPAVLIGGGSEVQWSRGGGAFSLTGGVVAEGRTYLIPLAPGEVLPRIPAGGLRSEEDVARLPGARRVDDPVAVPGPSPDVYAFLRTTTQRNLYRIPIQ